MDSGSGARMAELLQRHRVYHGNGHVVIVIRRMSGESVRIFTTPPFSSRHRRG